MSLLNRKLTKANTLALAMVLLLGLGLGYAAWLLEPRLVLGFRLRSELPRIYQHAYDQRQRLISAILAYQKSFGFYPPDHVITREPLVVDATTNQLFYELWGTVFDPKGRNFTPLRSSTHLSEALVQQFFNIDGFKNSAEMTNAVKNFLPEMETMMEVHDRPETIGVLSFWPNWQDADWDVIGKIRFGTWQYNSSKPAHNPSSFDLWLEIHAPGTNIVIGNW